MLNLYSLDSVVDLKKSPYFAEMKELKDADIGEGIYYNPDKLNEIVGDLSKPEARLFRLVSTLIQNDQNYSGIVQMNKLVLEKYKDVLKFSNMTMAMALSSLRKNTKEGKSPLLTKFEANGRVYWVNPAVLCKKVLIEKFKKEVPEDYVPEPVVEEVADESEASVG